MSEHAPSQETQDGNRFKDFSKLIFQGWRLLKRREQLGQIHHINTRLRKNHTNCDGMVTKVGDYAIYAEAFESGGGLRTVEYAGLTLSGESILRRVTILNQEETIKPSDIDHIMIEDIPIDGGTGVVQTYDGAAGLRAQPGFPMKAISEELTHVYKQAKPHLWPGDPFWL